MIVARLVFETYWPRCIVQALQLRQTVKLVAQPQPSRVHNRQVKQVIKAALPDSLHMVINQAFPICTSVVDGVSIVVRLLSRALDNITELPEEIARHASIFEAKAGLLPP